MHCDLSNRTAFVSGSTSGIGYAIAASLARAGARVAVNGRTESSVTAAILTLQGAVRDGNFVPAPGDVADADGAGQALSRAGTVDILVNNIGMYEPVVATQISEDQWQRMLEVNLLSGVRLTQRVLEPMMQASWGRILFIASDAGIAIPADMVHYGVSKAAVIAAARGFAKSARGTGVTVNSVIAGPTLTDGVQKFVRAKLGDELSWEEAEREFMRTERSDSLIERFIRPEEIANMVTYLASPLASATTGGAIRVDGGFVNSLLP